jgi:isopentenyl-diphosphate delta-isomerase
LGTVFQDWGIPTPDAVARAAPLSRRLALIASGGIRSGVDMSRRWCSGPPWRDGLFLFLEPAMESAER